MEWEKPENLITGDQQVDWCHNLWTCSLRIVYVLWKSTVLDNLEDLFAKHIY